MIVCIAIGLALGGIAEFAMSEEGLASFTDHLLDPAYNLLINILFCAAGPIIFFMGNADIEGPAEKAGFVNVFVEGIASLS